MDLLVGIGTGAGLASVAGVRAFVPLVAVLSIVVFSGFGNPPSMFMKINNRLGLPVICVLLALVVLESVLDKYAALGPPLDRAMVPIRALSGAGVFAIASVEWSLLDPMLGPMSSGHFVTRPTGLPLLAPYLVAGAAIAGTVAVLKATAPRPARVTPGETPASRPRVLGSFLGDAVTLVGIVVPWLRPCSSPSWCFSVCGRGDRKPHGTETRAHRKRDAGPRKQGPR